MYIAGHTVLSNFTDDVVRVKHRASSLKFGACTCKPSFNLVQSSWIFPSQVKLPHCISKVFPKSNYSPTDLSENTGRIYAEFSSFTSWSERAFWKQHSCLHRNWSSIVSQKIHFFYFWWNSPKLLLQGYVQKSQSAARLICPVDIVFAK